MGLGSGIFIFGRVESKAKTDCGGSRSLLADGPRIRAFASSTTGAATTDRPGGERDRREERKKAKKKKVGIIRRGP